MKFEGKIQGDMWEVLSEGIVIYRIINLFVELF